MALLDLHTSLFNEAAKVAMKATCLKARCGAIVVSEEGQVIGYGYNAPPLEDEEQRQCSNSYPNSSKPKSDRTCCVHAEWNAILEALKANPSKVKGSTLYFMRIDENGNFTEAGEPYCTVCSRLALQSGIKVFGLWNDGPEMWDTKEYNTKSYEFHE